mgnify:CR=1 FL=1
MALFQQIKEILGLNSGESDTETPSRNAGDTENVAVTVEHEPDTESEDAVKGTGADSTGSSTEETSTDVEAATAESDESVESEAAETGETASDTETEESASAPTGSAGTEDVQSISGIGPAYAERLAEADVETVADLAAADAEAVAETTGIALSRVEGWIDQARE